MPYPFADRNQSILRPAVILTDYAKFGSRAGVAVVAMITSAKRSAWPLDVPVSDIASAGLSRQCLVRLKLNSVEFALMERKIGVIAAADQVSIKSALRQLLSEVL